MQSSHPWRVSGIDASGCAFGLPSDGKPAFGGTPPTKAVIAALADIAARGLKATLYPFVMMDIPAGNTRPSPYGGNTQPAYPWRGRITCACRDRKWPPLPTRPPRRATGRSLCGNTLPSRPVCSIGGGGMVTGAAKISATGG